MIELVRSQVAQGLLTALDRAQIQAIIPHRPPMLLIDRVLEVEPGKRAVGEVWVEDHMDLLMGHFPGFPVMPGVFFREMGAQVGAVAVLSPEQNWGKLAMLTKSEGWDCRVPVKPGDVLTVETFLDRQRPKGNFGRGRGEIRLNGEEITSGGISYALMDPPAELTAAWV